MCERSPLTTRTPAVPATRRIQRLAVALSAAACLAAAVQAQPTDALPSWNDGPVKKAIVDFISRTVAKGGADYREPAERVAVFDNDGTLWSEQPIYVQFAFALDRVKAMAPQHPEWTGKEPFASVLKGDIKAALAGGERSVMAIIAATHAGMTTDEFERTVREWITTARHPQTKRLYTEMVYQPMLELLAYLRANGFAVYIVSGGGVDFMRPWTERVYGIPPDHVVGSIGKVKWEMRQGQPVLLKLAEVDFIDDGEGKPAGIHRAIGRRPIFAFGNSDGDKQMLEWTAAGPGARFMGLVHHTDGAREVAYDRTSAIGKLDTALDEANSRRWTVVSMKDDWRAVFPQ